MKIKKIMAAAAAAGLLLTGCSASEPTVTTENAPTDAIRTLAEISSDSSPDQVLSAFEMMISATAEAYDYRLDMRNTTETSAPYIGAEGLDSAVTVVDQRDIRYADTKGVYELLEQSSQGQEIMGLMDVTADGTDTVYASYTEGGFNTPDSKAMVQSVAREDSDTSMSEEEVKTSAQNMVTYPLYALTGANLILQPFAYPEYYNFSLTREGSDYVFSMSMKDSQKYNEFLDTYVEKNYGYSRTDLDGSGTFIADAYDTQTVDITLTLDENGVIKKILNNNFNVISENGADVKAYTKQTSIIAPAPDGSGTFFQNFFSRIADGTYKEGDTFDLALGSTADTDSTKEDTANTDSTQESAEQTKEKTDGSDSTQEKTDSTDTQKTADKKDDSSAS